MSRYLPEKFSTTYRSLQGHQRTKELSTNRHPEFIFIIGIWTVCGPQHGSKLNENGS